MISLAYSKPQSIIHEAVQQYARGKCDRQSMADTVSEVMRREGTFKIKVNNYFVRQTLPVVTSLGTFQAIILEAPHKTHEHCPACRCKTYGYLCGEAPKIKVMCLDCGCLYERRVPSETANAGG